MVTTHCTWSPHTVHGPHTLTTKHPLDRGTAADPFCVSLTWECFYPLYPFWVAVCLGMQPTVTLYRQTHNTDTLSALIRYLPIDVLLWVTELRWRWLLLPGGRRRVCAIACGVARRRRRTLWWYLTNHQLMGSISYTPWVTITWESDYPLYSFVCGGLLPAVCRRCLSVRTNSCRSYWISARTWARVQTHCWLRCRPV